MASHGEYHYQFWQSQAVSPLLHHPVITRSGDVFIMLTGLLRLFLETMQNVECFFKLSDIHNAIDTIVVTNPNFIYPSPNF